MRRSSSYLSVQPLHGQFDKTGKLCVFDQRFLVSILFWIELFIHRQCGLEPSSPLLQRVGFLIRWINQYEIQNRIKWTGKRKRRSTLQPSSLEWLLLNVLQHLTDIRFFANSFKTLRNEEEAFAASRFCNREVKSKKRSIKGCIVPKSPLSLPTDHFDVGAVHLC